MVWDILTNFFWLSIFSVVLGMITGFLVSFVLKKCRFFSHSAVHETFFLASTAMFTYYLSEVMGQSGITSLVVCALV